MKLGTAMLVCLVLTPGASVAGAGGKPTAWWSFDDGLADVSGHVHPLTGTSVAYAPGKRGRALRLARDTLTASDAPSLRLTPGFRLACRVYFTAPPSRAQQLVCKEGEYLLRVDDKREGGRFSFFVCLDGWEPRVSLTMPTGERWYDVEAEWTGVEMRLSVNGKTVAVPRVGTPKPTTNPVRIGPATCLLDEVKLWNPGFEQARRFTAAIKAVPPVQRVPQTHFGGADGWEGWQGEGATLRKTEKGGLLAHLPGPSGWLVNPRLEVDAGTHSWLSLDLRSPTAEHVQVCFVTDVSSGVAVLPVWSFRRTCLLDLASHPAWRGTVKLLALSVSAAGAHDLFVDNVWLADKPRGRPFLYVRNVAPGRAILRVGRRETVVAVVRNLGVAAKGVEVRLRPPPGVEVIGETVKRLPSLPFQGTARVEWTLAAGRAVVGRATVSVAWAGRSQPSGDSGSLVAQRRLSAAARKSLLLEFHPAYTGPAFSSVPPPRPAPSDYLLLMHYCPLWKVGTHYGWGKIENWPERRPALGWYDEGSPQVTDWQIKYALEHGIQGFIYCWYRADFSPEIHQLLGHAVHDGLMKAKYRDRFKFAIMWENGCGKGVRDRADLLDNLFPFWLKNYFTHPSYVTVDNKPLLFVWRPERVSPQVGGTKGTREAFAAMRAACRERGFAGLYLVGCVERADAGLLKRLAAEGWDATSAYATWGQPNERPGRDLEGITTLSHRAHLLAEVDVWKGKKAVGALPDIVSVMMGWDPRPWHGVHTRSYWAGTTVENFRLACRNAKRLVDATPGNGLDKRIVVFDNWDEFGEGHYLAPTAGFGFRFLDAIRQVFCRPCGPCRHVIPEDVGLAPPEHGYLERRKLLGGERPRRVVDDRLLEWTFDNDPPAVARDSSACHFNGLKQDLASAEGVHGKGVRCAGGTITLPADPLLFPPAGITVDLWLKTTVPNQNDRWILNTVHAANTGYRLGLIGGKLAWQIPQTPWSHLLVDPDPLPLGRWVHVVATYEGTVMRLYVNGRCKGRLPRRGTVTPSEGMFCLGSFGQTDRRHNFLGVLDEMKLFVGAKPPPSTR